MIFSGSVLFAHSQDCFKTFACCFRFVVRRAILNFLLPALCARITERTAKCSTGSAKTGLRARITRMIARESRGHAHFSNIRGSRKISKYAKYVYLFHTFGRSTITPFTARSRFYGSVNFLYFFFFMRKVCEHFSR